MKTMTEVWQRALDDDEFSQRLWRSPKEVALECGLSSFDASEVEWAVTLATRQRERRGFARGVLLPIARRMKPGDPNPFTAMEFPALMEAARAAAIMIDRLIPPSAEWRALLLPCAEALLAELQDQSAGEDEEALLSEARTMARNLVESLRPETDRAEA